MCSCVLGLELSHQMMSFRGNEANKTESRTKLKDSRKKKGINQQCSRIMKRGAASRIVFISRTRLLGIFPVRSGMSDSMTAASGTMLDGHSIDSTVALMQTDQKIDDLMLQALKTFKACIFLAVLSFGAG